MENPNKNQQEVATISNKPNKPKYEAFMIGCGLAILLQPFEVLRTRVVLEHKNYKGFSGLWRMGRNIYKNEGIAPFWRGSAL